MSAVTLRPAVSDFIGRAGRIYLEQYRRTGRIAGSGGCGPLRAGRRRVLYQNCHVAEEGGRVIGMVHSFPMTPTRSRKVIPCVGHRPIWRNTAVSISPVWRCWNKGIGKLLHYRDGDAILLALTVD